MKEKKSELAIIDFAKFDIQQLPELQGKKEEIKSVIKANPIVKIIDNVTYELAKKSRTAVKSSRTSLQNEQKDVRRKIKEFVLDAVDAEYDNLIEELKNAENERQSQVTIWEAKKEAERVERARLEELRVKNIKDAIQTFRNEWDDTISMLTFERIENCKEYFGKTCVEFDVAKLAEFEVLFDDSVSYLTNLLNSKIATLTEQENIRIAQIELAKEKELQRIEAEKITELQRIEREKFAKEQAEIAEKNRIAQEKFLAEKKEFEEKQADAKFKERCKQLTDLGIDMAVFELEHKGDVRWMNLKTSAKIESDYDWSETLNWVKMKISERDIVKPNEIVNLKSSETLKDVKIVENKSIVEDYHEADVDQKGIFTEEELTYDSIFEEFANKYFEQKEQDLDMLTKFKFFITDNFNVPTRK